MAEHIPKNNSYVYIPVDKFAELINISCPPGPCRDLSCRCHTEEDCIKCWQSWLKDGNENG